MTTVLKRNEIPMAYSMIDSAGRIKARRDGRHPIDKFFLYWTAFNIIYTTIAQRAGSSTQLILADDGTVETCPNGNVRIPRVKTVSERQQLYLSLKEFDDSLKLSLITHPSTKFFINRTPFWQGKPITHDALGQKLNGIINVSDTSRADYPIWSPIDAQIYADFLANPENAAQLDFLAKQIVDLLYTIRKNLMHLGTKFDDANDIAVFEQAFPLIEMIVASFTGQ